MNTTGQISSDNIIIAYGICADNNDPWGVGRIRVIIDNNFTPSVQSSLNVNEYITTLDNNNTTQNGENAYIPWERGSDARKPDPYVFEPFLPKHINIIPKIGESVKIIYYVSGDETRQREYIGPHVANYDHLKFDPIETARAFTSKSIYYPKQENFRSNGLIADPEDVGVFGRENSDIVLPTNSAVIRAGHQNFEEKIKDKRSAILQVSHFPTRKNITTETVTQDNTEPKSIEYMMEFTTIIYDKAVVPFYIETIVRIYPLNGVNIRNYNPYTKYLNNPDNAEYTFRVSSVNAGNIISFIKKFLKDMDNSYSLSSLASQQPENSKISLISPFQTENAYLDKRASSTGAALDETYNLGLYQFRPSPENDLSIQEVTDVANGLAAGLHPSSKVPTRELNQVEQEVTTDNPDLDENVVITGADKVFILSWQDINTLQAKIDKYGFNQNEIYLTLQKNTQPMVRGDMLLKLLNDIIDLIEKHGHQGLLTDPGNTLATGDYTKIKEIKDKYGLLSTVAKDLSGGSLILNQYLRLN